MQHSATTWKSWSAKEFCASVFRSYNRELNIPDSLQVTHILEWTKTSEWIHVKSICETNSMLTHPFLKLCLLAFLTSIFSILYGQRNSPHINTATIKLAATSPMILMLRTAFKRRDKTLANMLAHLRLVSADRPPTKPCPVDASRELLNKSEMRDLIVTGRAIWS